MNTEEYFSKLDAIINDRQKFERVPLGARKMHGTPFFADRKL